jgi:nitrate reductase gamma subunit
VIGIRNFLLIMFGAFIIFFLSIFVDFLMGKSSDYGYAIVLGIIFGIIVFLIRYLITKRMRKLS